MVRTSNCCCCFSLRTGSLILGWLQLIGAILNIITAIFMKSQDESNLSDVSKAISNPNAFWGSMLGYVIALLMASSLLYGIYAERKKFIFYYVYAQILIILLNIIILIVLLATGSVTGVAATIVLYVIVWLIQGYFIVVVYSLYKSDED